MSDRDIKPANGESLGAVPFGPRVERFDAPPPFGPRHERRRPWLPWATLAAGVLIAALPQLPGVVDRYVDERVVRILNIVAAQEQERRAQQQERRASESAPVTSGGK